MTADKIWINGIIYTADASDTVAGAVAVKDGQIIYVGKSSEAVTYANNSTEIIDLAGMMMLPAMTDSHIHAPGNKLAQFYQIDLNGIVTENATIDKINDFITGHPEMEFYYGSGYSSGAFSGEEVARGPRKERLDALCSKPIVISSSDSHTRWLNSAAFEYFGITGNTVPPQGGVIELTESGELWGTLKELAVELVPDQVFSKEDTLKAYLSFQEYMHSLGYVGITDMGSGIMTSDAEDLFVSLDKAGLLKLYVMKNSVIDPNNEFSPQLKKAAVRREAYHSELYNCGSLKFFADGVVEGVTAYLLKPYTVKAGAGNNYCSAPLWKTDNLNEAFVLSNSAGFQIHVHSIGDAATRQVLDGFAYALAKNGPGNYRNVITHLQLVDPADIPRFARMEIIANMQPYWAFKEPGWWEVVDAPLLGTERAEREYPMQSLSTAGTLLVSSSDHGVTPYPNPFLAIETAVTRNLACGAQYDLDDITDIDDRRWLLAPQERVSLKDMIKSFTINAAFQNFREDKTGSIEKGKSADFIVISQDIFKINPLDIADTKVLKTVFKGEVVWQAE